jgi:hypothetical protein
VNVDYALKAQTELLDSIEGYLMALKGFYEIERSIGNAFKSREAYIVELINISQNMDLKAFENHGVNLILKIRSMTINIINLVRKWSKHLSNPEIAYVTSINTVLSPRGAQKNSQCILCQILNDNSIQTKGGIPMRKLKFFLDDIRWFLPLSETKIEKKLAIVFNKIE